MYKYVCNDGEIIKIENESIKERVGLEEYEKWQNFNSEIVRYGYMPLRYGEYKRDLLKYRELMAMEDELMKRKHKVNFKRLCDEAFRLSRANRKNRPIDVVVEYEGNKPKLDKYDLDDLPF